MPKVICRDNFARDYNGGRSETVHGENLTWADAEKTAEELNARLGGPHSQSYFVVEDDYYKPYIFEGY